MNDQEMRIAIAEACGWKRCRTGHDCWIDPNGIHTATDRVRLPDYPHDLNAMHEAEKTLFGIGCEHYARLLCGVGQLYYPAAHASSRQRAEAFLRTIGKWKDAK